MRIVGYPDQEKSNVGHHIWFLPLDFKEDPHISIRKCVFLTLTGSKNLQLSCLKNSMIDFNSQRITSPFEPPFSIYELLYNY